MHLKEKFNKLMSNKLHVYAVRQYEMHYCPTNAHIYIKSLNLKKNNETYKSRSNMFRFTQKPPSEPQPALN